jgi:hypothetical protein
MRNAYKIVVRKPEWKRPLEDLDVDGKISEWILGVGRCGLMHPLRKGTTGGIL